MTNWVLYSRVGCHLCDEMLSAIAPLLEQHNQSITILDVDEKPELIALYSARVPVLEHRDEVICQYFVDLEAVNTVLNAE